MNLKEKFINYSDIHAIPVNLANVELFDAIEPLLNEKGFTFADAHSWNYENGEVEIEFYEGSMIVEVGLDCYKGKYVIEAKIRKFPGK